MRCGRKIGTRVPMRRNSMCGIARRRFRIPSSLLSLKSSASPPLSSTSRTSVCCFEIAIDVFELRVQFLLAHAADHAAARAISAIARAAIRHQKEHAVRITMHQTRHRHVRVLPARDRHFVRRLPALLDARDDLAADRTIRIVLLDQVEKVRRDRQRQLVPERRTPLRSSSESVRCCSSCASVVTRFLSCHRQSFQSSGATSGQ